MKKLKAAKEKGIVATVQDEGDDLLLIHKLVKDDWIFDSGCSNHLCGRKESFSSLRSCEDNKVTLPIIIIFIIIILPSVSRS